MESVSVGSYSCDVEQTKAEWDPEMSEEFTSRVVDNLITETALRLADQETVRTAVQQVYTYADYPTGWDPSSLAMGPLGNATLFMTLYGSNSSVPHNWKKIADELLQSCVESVVRTSVESDSLFGGAGGTLLAYILASRYDPKWMSVAKTLAESLADQTLALDSVPDEGGISDSDYDLISGRAGTLMAISIASRKFPESEIVRAAQNRLFDDINELLCRGDSLADTVWIHPAHYPNEDYIKEFPYGYFNMGLAHGLPGLLAALASTDLVGYRANQQRRIITELADIIINSALNDSFGLAWPSGYDRGSWRTKTTNMPSQGVPNAWCYGAPGIAVALSRAGRALDDKRLVQSARSAMQGALDRAVRTGSLESMSPTFCHGISGILACSVSVLGRSELRNPSSAQYKVATTLLSKANKRYPLFFQDVEEQGRPLDDPTILQGAAGIALTLTLVRGEHQVPGWQNLFGLE